MSCPGPADSTPDQTSVTPVLPLLISGHGYSSEPRREGLPIVVSIDCEPDPRVTRSDGPPPWDGLDGLITLLVAWRPRVAGARIGWYWRADAQVERGHGDAGWALETYRQHIDSTSQLGDEHGVHPHPWRWEDRAGTWVSDAADDDWVEHCITSSVAVFSRVLQRPVRVARMGDGHMSPRIRASLARAGVLCDMTLEPGALATASLAPGERTTGMIPDRTATPRRPFVPDFLDPCRSGPSPEPAPLWELPLTTAPAWLADVPPGTPANLGFEPPRFRRIVLAGMAASAAEGATYLSVVGRSDVGANPGLARFMAINLEWLATAWIGGLRPRFVGPLEALGMLGAC